MRNPRKALIVALQVIHAGELAAALAYQGHARAVSSVQTQLAIQQVECEEWQHRKMLASMLADLGAAPCPRRERSKRRLGSVLSFLCGWVGEWLPARIAGALERRGAVEYRRASALADAAGEHDKVQPLLEYATVEDAHGLYFEELALSLGCAFRRHRRSGAASPLR